MWPFLGARWRLLLPVAGLEGWCLVAWTKSLLLSQGRFGVSGSSLPPESDEVSGGSVWGALCSSAAPLGWILVTWCPGLVDWCPPGVLEG